MKVKITSQGTGYGTKVLDANGDEIKGVCSVHIPEFGAGEGAFAVVSIATAGLDVEAHPLLDLETTRASAEHHGYRLMEKPKFVNIASDRFDEIVKKHAAEITQSIADKRGGENDDNP